MPYPSKNSSTYTAPSKNSSSSSSSSLSNQFYLLIDGTYQFLIDSEDKFLIEPTNSGWSYNNKS